MGTFLLIVTLASLYFLPTIIAWGRRRMTAPVFVVNLFLGWTVIAWVIALAMAVSGPNQARPAS